MSDVGVVAIGRNEGERLRRCLVSLAGSARGVVTVYVDSGSTDGSVDLARSMGIEVIELDLTRPFSAARARNAGFERLGEIAPDANFVLFVDGDCEVVGGWIEHARAEFAARPQAGVVCGRRREIAPEASIYNRLADLEWDTPIGLAVACGGDSMVRIEAFRAAGGFDPSASAGEEPELCQRIRRLGWEIWRVDAEMTRHDLAMTRFRQWWRRQYRSGYNGLDIVTRFPGEVDLFGRGLARSRAWAIGWPLALVGLGLTGWWVGGGSGGLVGLGLAGLVMAFQILRLAAKVRRRVDTWGTALAYGALTMLAKVADVAGQLGYVRDRRRGQMARLIEYKRVEGPREPSPLASRAEARP